MRSPTVSALRRLPHAALAWCLAALSRPVAALREWSDPAANPFLARAVRSEGRRSRPLLVVAACMVVPAAMVALWPQLEHAVAANGGYSFIHLPPWAGGNIIGCLALLQSGATAYCILYAARVRAAALLRGEALKGTLVQLQLLPQYEERWLWWMSAQPVGLALLLGVAGLPLYAMAVFAGTWNALDLLMLMLVFALLGHITPGWQPMAWNVGGQRRRPDYQSMQAALRGVNKGVTTAALSPAGRLEHARLVRRTLSELGSDNSAPAGQELSPGRGKRRLALGGGNSLRVGRSGSDAWVACAMTIVLAQLGFAVVGSVPMRTLYAVLANIPAGITSLTPSFLISWPLMLARLLYTPLPFLAFVLPPIALLAPLAIIVGLSRNLTLASWVSPAETFWTPSRMAARASLQALLYAVIALLLLGYCWDPFINAGLLAYLLPGASPVPGDAVAALFTLLAVGGALLATTLACSVFAAVRRSELDWAGAWPLAARSVAVVLVAIWPCYWLLCRLGQVGDASPLWRARLLPVGCTALAFCLAVCGLAGLIASLPPSSRAAMAAVRLLWYGLAPAWLLFLLYRDMDAGVALDLRRAPWTLASPLVSVGALFALHPAGGMPWWPGPLLQAGAGAACLVWVVRHWAGQDGRVQPGAYAPARPEAEVARGRSGAWSSSQTPELVAPLAARAAPTVWRLLIAPVVWLITYLADLQRQLMLTLRALVARADNAVLRRAQRRDNPILTAEMRAYSRRSSWCLQWMTWQLLPLCLLFTVGTPFEVAAASAREWEMDIVFGCAIWSWLLISLGFARVPRSLDRDRANGALVFLFLTPLSDREVISGKLIPAVYVMLGALGATVVPLLFALTTACIHRDRQTLLVVVCVAAVMVCLFYCMAGLYLLCAICCTRPGLGAVLAAGLAVCISIIVGTPMTWALNDATWAPARSLLTGTFLPCGAALLVIAALAWRLAFVVLARRRYGDVAAGGKGIA